MYLNEKIQTINAQYQLLSSKENELNNLLSEKISRIEDIDNDFTYR